LAARSRRTPLPNERLVPYYRESEPLGWHVHKRAGHQRIVLARCRQAAHSDRWVIEGIADGLLFVRLAACGGGGRRLGRTRRAPLRRLLQQLVRLDQLELLRGQPRALACRAQRARVDRG